MATSAYFISQIYVRYHDDPVLMSLSPVSTPIYDVPFPALAFCNVNNIRKTDALQILKNGTEEDKIRVNDTCQPENSKNMTASVLSDKNQLFSFVTKVSQNCKEMVFGCVWKGVPAANCYQLFEAEITDEGMCCIFNRIGGHLIYTEWPNHLKDNKSAESIPWTPERGYLVTEDEDALPRRVLTTGAESGMSIVLNTKLEEYYCTPQLSVGIKVKAHSPNEAPDISSHSILVSPGLESRLTLVPKLIMASSSIRNLPVNKRNCYFSNERQLDYFKSYTEANCKRECLAKYTLRECGCIMFYMPGGPEDSICSRISERCAKAAKDKMYKDLIHRKRMDTEMVEELCDCLPNCFEIDYAIGVSANPILSEELLKRFPWVTNGTYFKKNMAVIQIYFSRSHITPYRRGLLYGFTDLVASTGGLLGLFMGFSILSVVEIIYFIFLRVCRWKKTPSAVSRSTQVDDIKFFNNYHINLILPAVK